MNSEIGGGRDSLLTMIFCLVGLESLASVVDRVCVVGLVTSLGWEVLL